MLCETVGEDITSPLCRGRVITLPSSEKTWVNFKYEQLPSLCYWCGRLNHDDRDYDIWMESNGTPLSTEKQQFDPFLRAPPFKIANKDVINVQVSSRKRIGGLNGEKWGRKRFRLRVVATQIWWSRWWKPLWIVK